MKINMNSSTKRRQQAGQQRKPVYSLNCSRGQSSFSGPMENEFMNRGYLLPDGCKDLKDAWLPKGGACGTWMMPMSGVFTPEEFKKMGVEQFFKAACFAKSKFKGMLEVPEQVSVLQLATMLNQNMSKIFADLLEIGGLPAVKEQLDFITISKIARKYGYIAKKAKE